MNTNNDAVELAARVGALEAILLSAPPPRRNISLAYLTSAMLTGCAILEAVIIYCLVITR